jgi:hypothetical protein
MIRHIVLLTFRPETDPSATQAIVDALDGLPAQIPALRRYEIATDAGLADGNADLVVLADVDDPQAWADYRDHPAHRRVIEEHILPVLEDRRAIQYEL